MTKALYGGVEAGGTKFICMVASDPENILEVKRIPTTNPQDTLDQVIQFFQQIVVEQPLIAVGIGSFGPLDLEHTSPTYGTIKNTPKSGWENTDIVGVLSNALKIRVEIDTDVNTAALGEYTWRTNKGYDPLLYLTIGTGIGGGIIVGGQPFHGLSHPEMGHLLIPHDRQADPFPGTCPYHKNCFEGLASGPAIQQRWGQSPELLPNDHNAWELEANYITSALVNLMLSFSPRRIVLGGGVMQRSFLFPLIRQKVPECLGDYLNYPIISESMENFIVSPALGNQAGVLGAIALAKQATSEIYG